MTVSGNLDSLEATLDALMQSAVCLDVSCSLTRTCEECLIHRRWDGEMGV